MTNRIDPTITGAIRQIADQGGTQPSTGTTSGGLADFQSLLEDAQRQELNFSKHAMERLQRREIPLNQDDLKLLSEGINRARQKGSRESLLLMDDTAFLVNVNDRRIITAVGEEGMKNKTFTNIDSAILLSRK